MTKVHIEEKFNTSMGIVLMVENSRNFKVGEEITCDDGNVYIIKGIQMATHPTEHEKVSLIVN